MRWTILVLTQPCRARFLDRLLRVLSPQIEAHPGIELLIRVHDLAVGGYGDAVELLRREARGEYISMVDDDDLVASDYVEKIFPLLDGVDFVGHKFAWSCDGVFVKTMIHSLRYRGMAFDSCNVYRQLSHLNPMKRELALRVPFSGGRNADQRWFEKMCETGHVKTEHFIDEVLYDYMQVSEYRRAK